MKYKVPLTCSIAVVFAFACGSKDDEETKDPPILHAGLSLPSIEFDVDGDRLLSTLTDEEIATACEQMASVMAVGDEGIACRIAAVGSTDEELECAEALEACQQDPSDALRATTIRTTPAPIDCSIFEASLTEGCDHPVSELQDCANALAASVLPPAEIVSCNEPGAYDNAEDAEAAAKAALDTGYVAVCLGLLECETLVAALLEGMVPGDGLGGEGGSQ